MQRRMKSVYRYWCTKRRVRGEGKGKAEGGRREGKLKKCSKFRGEA